MGVPGPDWGSWGPTGGPGTGWGSRRWRVSGAGRFRGEREARAGGGLGAGPGGGPRWQESRAAAGVGRGVRQGRVPRPDRGLGGLVRWRSMGQMGSGAGRGSRAGCGRSKPAPREGAEGGGCRPERWGDGAVLTGRLGIVSALGGWGGGSAPAVSLYRPLRRDSDHPGHDLRPCPPVVCLQRTACEWERRFLSSLPRCCDRVTVSLGMTAWIAILGVLGTLRVRCSFCGSSSWCLLR